MKATVRALLLALLLTPIMHFGYAAHAQQADSNSMIGGASPPRIVVVGVPGLRWSDVNATDTPALARLARTAAAGVLSVRTAAPVDCPTDGWLTLGAGDRVRSTGRHTGSCPTTFPPPSSLPEQVRANADRREGARPGLLGDVLQRNRLCLAGGGPGAQLGAAASDGSFGATADVNTLLPLSADASSESSWTCDVVLLQGTAVGTEARASGARAADALVARIDETRPAGSTLLVVGLSEAPGERHAHLHVAIAAGPGFRHGALTSASSRRPPYVQLVDVAPTILSLLDIETPDAMVGEPWRSTDGAPSLAGLRDHERKSDGQRNVTVPFFVILVGVQLLLAGIGLLLRRWRVVELVALAGTTAVGASYLANLAPWWRSDHELAAMLGVTAAATAVLTGICLLGRGLLARAGIACGLTATVLVIDVLTGAHLQMSSVAGYSPVVAGRFAGIGNVAFGVLAASALLAAASTRSATVAALTALVVVVDGAPMWGSDVGGVLALVPAYTLLVLLLAGREVNAARLAVAAVVGGLVVTAFGVVDHARPTDQQTHLGRFVGQVLDGTAGTVLRRKAEANLALLFHSPVTALLPLVVAFLLVLLARPPAVLRGTFERSPAWRAGLLAVLTASGLGAVLNDSGVAVPALAIVVALPATLAVLARHARGSAGAG
ncbi:MAG: hypothetical protein QOE05_1942 [Actinomycetota bacterium]|nr:hypothetical protein [Actinomycetota bacterium]